MKACIILPTYNEKKNLPIIVDGLLHIFPYCKGWYMSILIVDDNSPDGTGDIAERLSYEHKNVEVLTGEKKGLGAAYIRGFQWALKKDFDVVFEMDADLSHKPRYIPTMLKKIEKGSDLVIGSRYIAQGKIEGWGIHRKLISAGGNFFARIIAGIYHVHDCTSGFRALRVTELRKVALSKLSVKGYSFQMNLLFDFYKRKTTITEIPITFVDRKYGTSKIGPKDILEFVINAFKLRFRLI